MRLHCYTWRHKLAIAICAFLCLFSFGLSVWLGLLPSGSASTTNAEGGGTTVVASPYFNYTEISSVAFRAGQNECIYRGMTTAAGLKRKIDVTGTYNSQSYRLAGEEYNLYLAVGAEERLLGDSDVILDADSTATEATIIVRSGTFSRELNINQIKDAEYYTDVSVELSGTLTDDYTNDNIADILKVTAGTTVLDNDLYTPEITFTYSGNADNLSVSATLTVTYSTGENATATKTLTPQVRFAELQGAAVAVKNIYTYASDGTYRDGNNYSVFNQGMSRRDVLEKLNVFAVYPHSLKKLELEFNGEGGTLSGTKSGEKISVTPDSFMTASAQIVVTLTDRKTDTISQTSPVLSLNFTERTVVKIEVDQTKVDTILSNKTIYPYTNVKSELLDELKAQTTAVDGDNQPVIVKGAITLIYSDGSMVDPASNVWNDLSFDLLSPTSKDVEAGINYNKDVKISYNYVTEVINFKNIQYQTPVVDQRIAGSLSQQIMHQSLDFSGLTIPLYYENDDGEEITVAAPLSDFFDRNNLAQTAKHIKLTLREDSTDLTPFDETNVDIKNTIITKSTTSVLIQFSYDNEKWTNARRFSFTPSKESIAPTFDRSTISFSDDCYKELKNGNQLLSEIPSEVLQVSVLMNETNASSDSVPASGTFENSAYDVTTGKISFQSGGQFYIRLDIVGKQDEYEFFETTDREITRTAIKYVIPVFIAKGSFTLTTEYSKTEWQYGDTEANLPKVWGTLGSQKVELPFATSEESQLPKVCLAYFPITNGTVDWTGYSDLTYENAGLRATTTKLTVGTYRVVAVTEETVAYSASKSRQSAAVTVTVTQREISDSDLNQTITYDRNAHDVVDDTALDGKLVYGDQPSDVFQVSEGNAAYTYVGDYAPTLTFIGDKPNYAWKKDDNSDGKIDFKIIKRTFGEFSFDLTATETYYGVSSAPTQTNRKYGNGVDDYYTVNAIAYYAASAGDPATKSEKPLGDQQTGSIGEWAVGYYYAYIGTTAKCTGGEQLNTDGTPKDFELPCYAVKFEIKPAEITPIELGISNTNLGTYQVAEHDVPLTHWTEYVVHGNTSLLANEYLEAVVVYTPKIGTSVTTNPATVIDGKLHFTNAGEYKVTVSITNTNVQWTTANAEGEQNYAITFTVTIDRATIGEKPASKDLGLTYNGEDREIAIQFSGLGTWDSLKLTDKATYKVTVDQGSANEGFLVESTAKNFAGKFSVHNAGKYTVVVSLTDKNNYQWLTDDVDDCTVEYTVKQAEISVTWNRNSFIFSDKNTEQDTPKLESVTPSYNGELIIGNLSTIVYTDEACTNIVNSGTVNEGKVTAAGTYYIKVTDFSVVTGEKLNYVLNYVKSDSKLILPFTVDKQGIVKPASATIEVNFDDGSPFDFYKVATEKGLTLPDKKQLTITGADALRNVVSDGYPVTVTPASDYKWTDGGTDGVTFKFVIEPKNATFEWNVGNYTYDGKTPFAPTITKLEGLAPGDSVDLTVTGGQMNAGKYTATGKLGGTHAANYNVTNTTQSFTVKKAVLLSPDMGKTEQFTRTEQTFNLANWTALNGKINVSVAAKDAAGNNPGDYTYENDALKLLHAGDYTLTFTINDANKGNYCWNAADQEKFGADSVTVLKQTLTVNRETLTAPALGETRTRQFAEPLPLFGGGNVGLNHDVPYTVSYGYLEQGTNNYVVLGDSIPSPIRERTYYVKVILENTDGVIAIGGKSFSIYDFEWSENKDDTDRLGLIPYGGKGEIVNDGTEYNLHFVYTKTLVDATFTLFNGNGYTFGENGVGGKYLLGESFGFKELVEGGAYHAWFAASEGTEFENSLEQIINSNENVTVFVKFYTSEALAEAGTAGTEIPTINGLPWDAGKYFARINVQFGDMVSGEESNLNDFFKVVEFDVHKFTITLDMVTWAPATTIYNGNPQMRNAPELDVSKLPKATADETPIAPTLTVQAWVNGDWEDTVTNVLYSGNSVAAYDVYVTAASGNYTVGDKTIGSTYQINPASITALAGVGASKVYGDPLGNNYTFTQTGILSGDEGVIAVNILDGSNNVVTAGSPVSGTYYVVPRLKTRAESAAAGNYTLTATVVKGSFTITARPIKVTIKSDQSAVFGEDFDLNRTDGKQIYTIDGSGLYSADSAKEVFTLTINNLTNTQSLSQGLYTVSCAGNSGNYTITFDGAHQFTVTAATIIINTVTPYGGTYDGMPHDVLTAKDATFAIDNAENVKWWISNASSAPAANSDNGWTEYSAGETKLQVKNAGSYLYWVRVTAKNHDPAVYGSQITVTINKAELTVKANFSIYYNEEKPEVHDYLMGVASLLTDNANFENSAYTVTNLQNGESVKAIGLGGTFSYTTDYAQGKDVGTYSITLTVTNLTSTNYTFKADNENSVLTVKKLPIKVNTSSRTDDKYSENVDYNSWQTWLNTEEQGYTVALQNSTYNSSDKIALPSTVKYSDLFTISNAAVLSLGRTNDVGTYPTDMTLADNSALLKNYEVAHKSVGTIKIGMAESNQFSEITVSNWIYGSSPAQATNPTVTFKWSEGGAAATEQSVRAVLSFRKNGDSAWTQKSELDLSVLNGWTYNVAPVFKTAVTFGAGEYQLVLTMARNKNYPEAKLTVTFNVTKRQLTYTATGVKDVVYGDGFGVSQYGFTTNDYVNGDEGKIELGFEIQTDYSTTNRYVRAYPYRVYAVVTVDGHSIALKDDLSTEFEVDNYKVKFDVATFNVTERELTVKIDNHTNIYHYLGIGENGYVPEKKQKTSYAVTSDVKFYASDESAFMLKTDAYTGAGGTQQTNDAGRYPIYAVFSDENLLNSYKITIVTEDGGYGVNYVSTTGELVVADAGSGYNAALFTITKAKILLDDIRPFYLENGERQYYDTSSIESMYYDGRNKNYEPTLQGPNGESLTDVSIVVEYFKDSLNGDSLGIHAPKDVGNYAVRFTFAEHKNYEPAKSSTTFGIYKRPLNVQRLTPEWTYTGIARAFTVTFGNLVDGELLSKTDLSVSTISNDSWKIERSANVATDNVFTFTTTNAGTYTFTIDFKNVQNYSVSESNNQVDVNFTIAKRTLTVKAENTTIQYGTPVSETTTGRFGGFTAIYSLNQINGRLSDDALIQSEINYNHLLPQGSVTFTSSYQTTSEANSEFPITVSGVTETTNFIIKLDNTGTLTVIPRELKILVKGYSDNNRHASHLYDGTMHHNTYLNGGGNGDRGLLNDHITEFLSLASTENNAFGNEFAAGTSLSDKLRALSVRLTVDANITNVSSVGYAMRPSSSNGNYQVTFVGTKKGNDVSINNVQVSDSNALEVLPNYYIKPLELKVKVVRNVDNPVFSATRFDVVYGDEASFSANKDGGGYYTLMYDGWLNAQEGTSFGIGNALSNNQRIERCSIAGYNKNGTGNGKTEYAPWSSIAGDYYTITPVINGVSFTNYRLDAVPTNMHVVSRTITQATAKSERYTEEVDGSITNYRGGAYGATLPAEITFENQGQGTVAHANYTYRGKRTDGDNTVPNRADTYEVSVSLTPNTNGEYNYIFGSGVTGRQSDTSAVVSYTIEKKTVTLRCANQNNAFEWSENATKTNALGNFVKDVMLTPVSFTRTSNGTSYDVAFDYADGLPFTPDQIGTYLVVVQFNPDAATNYCWDNEQQQGTLQFVVTSDGIISISSMEIAGWTFGTEANTPEIEILPAGSPATVVCAYASVADRAGLVAGMLDFAALERLGISSDSFKTAPFNAGWYVVRATATGVSAESGLVNTAVAYYLFRIEKASVDAPEFNVSAANNNYRYTGSRLTAIVSFPSVVLMGNYTGSWESGANGSVALYATNQGTYTVTFNLSNTSNYQWADTVATKDLVTIANKVHLRLVRNGDTLVYTWTVIPASDNTVRWTNGQDTLDIIYGDEFSVSASAYYPSATVVYEFAPRGKEDTQAPTVGWTANRPYYGGLYWVRARAYSSAANFNEATVTLRLTINKKALSLDIAGSLVYGQSFDEGRYSFDIAESLTQAERNRIFGSPAAYLLADGTLNQDRLSADVYELTLRTKTENGVQVVDGLASNDFYFPIANVSGNLTVNRANISVQIGNAASCYSEEIDLASALNEMYLVGGGLADWESELALKDLLKPTLVPSASATSNVGNYAIRCTAYDNGNYNVTFNNGIYRIEQLRIRIEISSGGGTYGDETIEGARVTGIFKESDDSPITDTSLTFSYIYTGVSNDGTWRYENGASTTDCPMLAGTYTATAVNPENENYLLVGTSSVPFVVEKMAIDAGMITAPNQFYTGNAISPAIVDSTYNVDGKIIYEVRPVGNWVNAGTYEITLVMKDFANMKWLAVDVQERTIPFVIDKAKNALTSEIEIAGWTYGLYDASVNTPHATSKFGTPVFYYATSENGEYTTGAPRGGSAGDYFVRAYVAGTDNYEEFALTDGRAVSFKISPVVVEIPVLHVIHEGEGKNDTYAATDLSASITGFNASLMSIAYDGRLSVSGNDVEVFARNVGNYTVTIGFNDNVNYVWATGGDAETADSSVTLNWTIAKKQLAKPTANEDLFIVNGRVLVYEPVGFDSEVMNISGNEQGYGGTFTVIVTLKDLDNYEWIGGTNEAIEFAWEIVGVNTVFTVIVGCLSGGCAIAVAAAVAQGVLMRRRRLADEKEAMGDAPEGGDGVATEQQDTQSKNQQKEEEKSND